MDGDTNRHLIKVGLGLQRGPCYHSPALASHSSPEQAILRCLRWPYHEGESEMVVSRASVFACLIGLLTLSSVSATAQAIESPSTYPEAIREDIGESGGALLKTFCEKMAMGDYVGGVQRYAKAKAAFDGLIRQLDAEAGEVQARANSERFQAALKQAAEARIAFTQYVEATHNTDGLL